MKKYLVSLPTFASDKSWNCRTILVSAKNIIEAKQKALRLSGASFVGLIKTVKY